MYWQTRNTWQRNAKVNKIGKCLDLCRLGDSFLDAGCGTGTAYGYLRPRGYVGIDFYQENIDKALQIYPQADFRVGNIYELDGEYDIALCCRVLMHLEHPEEAIKSLMSVGKQVVVITELGEDKVIVHDDPGPHYYRTFSEKTMKSFGKCEIHPTGRYSTIIYG